MKEKKQITSLALKPTVKDKLRELSEVNNYSMSGYLEVLILEQWRDYKNIEAPPKQETILSNGKPYVESTKVGGRVRDDRFFKDK